MDKTKNITRRDPKYYKTIPPRGITLDFASVGLVFCGLGGEEWPTWGRGARLVRWALDVGLDSFAL